MMRQALGYLTGSYTVSGISFPYTVSVQLIYFINPIPWNHNHGKMFVL